MSRWRGIYPDLIFNTLQVKGIAQRPPDTAVTLPRGNGNVDIIDEAGMLVRPLATARRLTIAAAVLAIALGCGLVSCNDQQTDTKPAAPAPAQPAAIQAPPPKPVVTLILTWMNADQPPQTTQTAFHDLASCVQARDAAIAEGRRLALEALATQPTVQSTAQPSDQAAGRRYLGRTLLPADAGAPPPAPAPTISPNVPKVAAICAST